MHILVVVHEATISKLICDIVASHQHTVVVANTSEEATFYYKQEKIDAVIIDMPLPVHSDSRVRRENGRNLIRTIRSFESTKLLPIIAIAQSKVCDLDFVISIMKRGRKHEAYIDCVVDSLTNDRLDNALDTLMHYQGKAQNNEDDELTSRRRVLTIEDDAIKMCGYTVWHQTGCDDLRHVVLALSQCNEHGYVRIPGTALNEYFGRDISNSIATIINRFKRACSRILTEHGIECGVHDIIGSARNGGYHLQPHIIIDLQTDAGDPIINETPTISPVTGLSELACRLLHLIHEEPGLQQRHLIDHFRQTSSASTIKRALATLRSQGFVQTNAKHEYHAISNASDSP